MTDTLADGVYVDLSDDLYFGQPRLGSTDLVRLAKDPASYWYASHLNPDRPGRKQTDEMAFGTGLHALVLEGEDAYLARCVVRPDEYPDAKTGEAKPWHGAAGFCKDWLEQHAGFTVLDSGADRRIRHMAALILNHPELGGLLRGGMPEVAILYTHESGVKLRAKIDYMVPRFRIDLKSFGGDAKGLTTTQQVLSLVAQRSMDVQRFQYAGACSAMGGLLDAGAVFGATPEQAEWLKRVAAVEDWSWVWIFFRRRDDERGFAPVIKPILRSHSDATFESGRRKVEAAIANYQAFMARFGADVPWAIIESAEEPPDHAFPQWMNSVNAPVDWPEAEQEEAA